MALLVPVDHHIPGGSATGDDVEFSVLVEVGDLEVLASHLVVINEVGAPLAALAPGIEFDADLSFLVLVTPPGDDLKTVGAENVGVCEGVALIEGVIQDSSFPPVRFTLSTCHLVNCHRIPVHGFNTGVGGWVENANPDFAHAAVHIREGKVGGVPLSPGEGNGPRALRACNHDVVRREDRSGAIPTCLHGVEIVSLVELVADDGGLPVANGWIGGWDVGGDIDPLALASPVSAAMQGQDHQGKFLPGGADPSHAVGGGIMS